MNGPSVVVVVQYSLLTYSEYSVSTRYLADYILNFFTFEEPGFVELSIWSVFGDSSSTPACKSNHLQLRV